MIIGSSPPVFGDFPRSTFGTGTTGMRVIYRDGALDQVTPLPPRVPGPGVLVTDEAARALGARPGDTIRIGAAPVRVVGTYRNLTGEPVRPFWCSTFRLFTPPAGADVAVLAAVYAHRAAARTRPAEILRLDA